MFYYVQKTGNLYDETTLLGSGYSGHGIGLNNPVEQYVENVGPIPTGVYTIGPPFTHPHAGLFTMRLKDQDPCGDHGRDGFMMHGDNALVNHSASDGCIVMPRPTRLEVDKRGGTTGRMVEVVTDEAGWKQALAIRAGVASIKTDPAADIIAEAPTSDA